MDHARGKRWTAPLGFLFGILGLLMGVLVLQPEPEVRVFGLFMSILGLIGIIQLWRDLRRGPRNLPKS
jgi:hypothetical protein